jgi:hypothetical protein
MALKARFGSSDKRLTVIQHMNETGAWATRGRAIEFQATGSSSWTSIARFPLAFPTDLATPSRLARRVLRTDRCNVYPTRSGKLLGIRAGVVYRIEPSRLVPLFEIRGDCVMSRAIAETEDGELFFGEYFMNPSRVAVRVWRVGAELDEFGVARELDTPRVRHVHAVHADPHVPGRLWMTSGDFENECYLSYTDDRFETLHNLGDGSQLWRIVGLGFLEDRLVWMTDSHIAQNHIVVMDRESCAPRVIGDRDASSWYLARTTDGRFLATSCVEPGTAIQTNRVRLMVSEDAMHWETVARFEKDDLPFRAFGFGYLSLPSGEFSSEDFWISGDGLRSFDGASQRVAIHTDDAGAA